MLKYFVKRILLLIPVMMGVILLVFGIMELSPGDPAIIMLGNNASPDLVAKIHKELKLDDPFIVRFANYVGDLFRGDMGISYKTKRPVLEELMTRLPTTMMLAIWSITLAVIVGIPLGILSAVRQYSIFDNIGVTLATILAAVPGFWLGLMLILLFALKLGWLPSNGSYTWVHLILPTITNGAMTLASLLRMTRATMLETIRADYITTVRAKGQREFIIIFGHALRNAVLPVIVVVGMEFGYMLGGALVIEQVFSINGLGSLMINAIRSQDLPVVTGVCVLLSFLFVMIMLLIDILQAFIDPRVKTIYMKGSKA